MMHSGHYNAIRQAKALGGHLVVGLISDKEVSLYKGPPVLTWDERADIIRSCKWVDEVVESADYNITMETLEKNNCDFVVHGDDPVFLPDGSDAYQPFRDANKFKTFKRTVGVSTTDIVGRLLTLAKDSERRGSN
jgi:ethanolamine-phosphate cytidylyltransferase